MEFLVISIDERKKKSLKKLQAESDLIYFIFFIFFIIGTFTYIMYVDDVREDGKR